MYVLEDGRAKPVLVLICFLLNSVHCQYSVPDVTIRKITPKGVRVSIPDAPSMSLFVFQGNVNQTIGKTDEGFISGEVTSPANGSWTFEVHPNVELNNGDVIKHYVFGSINRVDYMKDNLSYTVTDTPVSNMKICLPSLTEIRGSSRKICSGETIFNDEFLTLNQDVWQIEQKLPIDHPEYPFVSYQRPTKVPTVKAKDGMLTIKPHLQQFAPGFNNDSIYSGTLDLYDGCTEDAHASSMMADGANILPPIVSGRISSKGFAFKFGTVTVRAKLPQGDWIYPEILLEPFMYKYGRSHFASGVIKIASARGNNQLYLGPSQYGNKVLYGGPIIDFKCSDMFLKSTINRGRNWGDDFHNYAARWEPDRIRFLVDDVEWARVDINGLGDQLPRIKCPDAPRTLWATGEKWAPFDEYFYLTLGIAAGGVLDFRDGLYTNQGLPKPWTNLNSKAKLRFWQDLDQWYQTWNSDSVLTVDSVKVTAL